MVFSLLYGQVRLLEAACISLVRSVGVISNSMNIVLSCSFSLIFATKKVANTTSHAINHQSEKVITGRLIFFALLPVSRITLSLLGFKHSTACISYLKEATLSLIPSQGVRQIIHLYTPPIANKFNSRVLVYLRVNYMPQYCFFTDVPTEQVGADSYSKQRILVTETDQNALTRKTINCLYVPNYHFERILS